jgi:hypothetical protein
MALPMRTKTTVDLHVSAKAAKVVALNAAVEFLRGSGASPEGIVQAAKVFEEYVGSDEEGDE